MIRKVPINSQRLRRMPKQFSWLDQRLVRDQWLQRCTHPALALYLFLVIVADKEGLSYYSNPSIADHLHLDEAALDEARRNLIEVGLIAYRKPFYQVLDVDPSRRPQAFQCREFNPDTEHLAVRQILRQWLEAQS